MEETLQKLEVANQRASFSKELEKKLEEDLLQIELANKRAKNSEEKAELVQKEKNEMVREKPGYPVSLNSHGECDELNSALQANLFQSIALRLKDSTSNKNLVGLPLKSTLTKWREILEIHLIERFANRNWRIFCQVYCFSSTIRTKRQETMPNSFSICICYSRKLHLIRF